MIKSFEKMYAFEMGSTQKRKLAVFSNGAIMRQDVFLELGKEAGFEEEAARITEAENKGSISMPEAFERRLILFKGLDEGRIRKAAGKAKFRNNFAVTMSALKRRGYYLVLITENYKQLLDAMPQRRVFDYVIANELEVIGGKSTGKGALNVSDKGRVLRELQAKLFIPRTNTGSVGYSASDIPLFQNSEVSIAFNAVPEAKEFAHYHLDGNDLSILLPAFP